MEFTIHNGIAVYDKEELIKSYPAHDDLEAVVLNCRVYRDIILERVNGGGCINLFCKGTSGAIYSTVLWGMLKDTYDIGIFMYREGTNHHDITDGWSSYVFVKYLINATNIVIDDFVSTGSTIRKMLNDSEESGFYLPEHIDMIFARNAWRNFDKYKDLFECCSHKLAVITD